MDHHRQPFIDVGVVEIDQPDLLGLLSPRGWTISQRRSRLAVISWTKGK